MYLTSKTPLRVSFIGGGTDYQSFFQRNNGYVIGTAIDLFVYVALLKNNSLSNPGFRMNYRQHEEVLDPSEFLHPVVRVVLTEVLKIQDGISISTLADVPARSGLGSSSAFTVGLLNAINRVNGLETSPESLAEMAIHVERVLLNEPGGWQDQFFSAFGGFQMLEFSKDGVTSHKINNEATRVLDHSMILCSTGITRANHDSALATLNFGKLEDGRAMLSLLNQLTISTFQNLEKEKDEISFLETLSFGINEAWKIKKKFAPAMVPTDTDSIIKKGFQSGAIGAKLCGSGGGGFILFLVPPDEMSPFIAKMKKYVLKRVKPNPSGTLIL